MVKLAGELFDAPVHEIERPARNIRHLLFPLLPRQQVARKPDLLMIVARPRQLLWLADHPGWRNQYNRAVAWVIDSFWTDKLPAIAVRGKFDRIYVVTGNDAAEYQARTGIEARFLGIGSDALRISQMAERKDIDLMRLGRQPPAWSDDAANAAAFGHAGLTYQGRTPFMETDDANIRSNATYYARAKFVMAHTNLSDQKYYTHRAKEYITERWTDALSSGASVVGRPPMSDWAVSAELWPGALHDVSDTDHKAGVARISQLVADWKPADARRHRRLALERLDWRHRFAEIAAYLGHQPPRLVAELDEIRAAADALAEGSGETEADTGADSFRMAAGG